jgi:DNA polymerase I
MLDAVGEVAEPAAAGETLEVDVTVVRDTKQAVGVLRDATKAPRVALEARWAGVQGRSSLLGLALATDAEHATYLSGELLEDDAVTDALGELVGPSGTPLVAHRGKELMHGLRPVDVRSLQFDTAVMAYLLDPGEGKYLLDDLALRYLSVELQSPDKVEGTLDLDGDASAEDIGRRAALLLRLADTLAEALQARELTDLYERFERPLVRVLADMEVAGIRIDVDFLAELGKELTERCRALEAEVHAHAGETFNVNSTPQLRKVLFDNLGLTPVKKTKTGPSTDADSLQKMAEDHPIVETLLRYREVEKLRSTYTDALPPLVQPDGRIHATFNQIATTTGRISSESPNMQNVPVRTSEGRELRRAFVADEGAGLLTADYSQIELRVLAHLANDPGLIEAFERDADIHTATAAKVFNVDEEKVDPFQRRFAKVVNYGLAYGMEAYGLGQRLDIPTEQAREILDAYFEGFPNVRAYMQESVREAKARGYTTTIFGRRRPFPDLKSPNRVLRDNAQRAALNAPIQGSAADIMKIAMVNIEADVAAQGLGSRMLMQVHDELIFEVVAGEWDALETIVRDRMANAAELTVPLEVQVGRGHNWDAAAH